MIESGVLEGRELGALLSDLLQGGITPPPDGVVLGCTHYPLIEKSIRAAIGSPVEIFQGGPGTARETRRRLEEQGLRRMIGPGQITFQTSSTDPEWIRRAQHLFQEALEDEQDDTLK